MSPLSSRKIRAADELRIIRRSLQGDRKAYSRLVQKYQSSAVAFAYAVTGDFHLAEDVAQEAFVRAFEGLSSLEHPDKFGAWLRSIVRHTATDMLRRNHWTASIEQMAESGYDPADTTEKPAQEVAREELHSLVDKAIASLRSDYREIIVLRHIEQRSYKEIAELLGMTTSAVGEKLSRVRDILRRKLRSVREAQSPTDKTQNEKGKD